MLDDSVCTWPAVTCSSPKWPAEGDRQHAEVSGPRHILLSTPSLHRGKFTIAGLFCERSGRFLKLVVVDNVFFFHVNLLCKMVSLSYNIITANIHGALSLQA